MNLATLLLASFAITNSTTNIENPARVTSDSTYYDRKEGIAVFKGNVHVDDEEYQMHSQRAFVYLTETNTLSRIVAVGSVALTNDIKRAYAEKATYFRDKGLVILVGIDNNPAIVMEDLPDGPRTVRGRKIRFWINQEQVEVVEADITAPKKGGGADLPGLLK